MSADIAQVQGASVVPVKIFNLFVEKMIKKGKRLIEEGNPGMH